MKTIMDFIGTIMALAGVFLLTCAIATILFVMHWANGVVLLFERIGADKLVESLPLTDPAYAHWVMWAVALFTSLAIIAVLIKMIEVVRNSLWTVAACGMMMMVVALPVYNSYLMGGFQFDETKESIEQNIKTSTIETIKTNIEVEL